MKNSGFGSRLRMIPRACRANPTQSLALLLLGFLALLATVSFGQDPSLSPVSANRIAQASALGLPSGSSGSNRCVFCHPAEVAGYARSAMAHSLRPAGREPEGTVNAHGSKITMHSSSTGSWQRWVNKGEAMDFRIAYVIGSGAHADGYLVDILGHLFQSPVAFYTSRQSYDLAPGYENLADPDFSRPVVEECVLCHSGTALHVSGTRNEYRSPIFTAEAITCERCHGPVERHLAEPRAGTIVNPAKLEPAARDSICEQCHLFGIARVPNPGKEISDFVPGQPLEDTYTVYHDVLPPGVYAGGLKVISHVEQLALSACARNSGGRFWCGTCHNPHDEPLQPVQYYRARCLSCHTMNLPASHPSKDSDCLTCHMPRRNAQDGGHSVFTDHRIQRRPSPQTDLPSDVGIAAWREPAPNLQRRNLGIAYIDVGIDRHSPSFIQRGYRILTEVQHKFTNDSEFFEWIGAALLAAKQTSPAELAFERALQLDPDSPLTEASAAPPYIQAGDSGRAISHLERALKLDPLYLPAATDLIALYEKQGKSTEAGALSAKIKALMSESSGPDQTGQDASLNGSSKRAEDVFKNIQILKGAPADQMIPAMEFISSSLGVECSFCHVESHFEKDDKKPKQTARGMMKMMFALNKNNFDGQLEVTCYSCHRGARNPDSTPLVNEKPPQTAKITDPGVPKLPANLPTISQLLDDFIAATGGSSSIEEITTRVEKGTESFQGRSVSVEIFSKSPQRQVVVRHLPNGDSAAIFDGRSGWFLLPGRALREIQGADLDAARMDADLQFPLHIRQFYPELRIEYPEMLSGSEAYVVYGSGADEPATKFCFDEQSGLLLRIIRYADSPLGRNPSEVDYADYRDVGHVKVPFRVTFSQPGSVTILHIENVQQNIPIDDAVFARPISDPLPSNSISPIK